jgi:thioesterase domain-containing protein
MAECHTAEMSDLLANLAKLGIRLWRNRRLEYEVPRGVLLSPQLIERLDAARDALSAADSICSEPYTCMVPLTATAKSAANLVCVHTLHGTIFDYRYLLPMMPQDFGVYGVQAIGMLIDGKGVSTVEQMAAHYLDDLRRSGIIERPWVLYGGCTGGFVALEIARGAYALGKPPAALVIGDTRDFAAPPPSIWRAGMWISFIEAHMPNMLVEAIVKKEHAFWSFDDAERITYVIETVSAMSTRAHSLPLSGDVLREHFEQFLQYARAYPIYVPNEYHGSAVYLKARTASWGLSAQFRSRLMGPCRLEDMPNGHVGLFREKGARAMATQLIRALAEACESASGFDIMN